MSQDLRAAPSLTHVTELNAADARLIERMTLPGLPRSAGWDPRFALEHLMGPNVLWLAESLSQVMDLRPGMRVLDLGCGKAISSIFLASEFDLQVWATDLWIGATDNLNRIRDAGVEDRVFPIHAEAHALPFAEGIFDAVVSLDAYQYFGTDDLYLAYLARFVKPGGQIGIVCPGFVAELDAVPEHLAPWWEPEFWCFHGPAWWRSHWERSGAVSVEHADLVPNGWEHWLRFSEVCAEFGYPRDPAVPVDGERDAEMLRTDAGRTIGFSRVVGQVSRGGGGELVEVIQQLPWTQDRDALERLEDKEVFVAGDDNVGA